MNVRASRWSMLFVVVAIALPSLAAAQPACQPGRYDAGTGTCEECVVGKFNPATGQTDCFTCEAGRFTNVPGRTACNQCSAGRYSNVVGATVCSSCEVGAFEDSTGQTSCSACAAGRYGHSMGLSSCVSCEVGKFSNATGVSGCASCVAGKFAHADGLTSCRSCDAGKYADAAEADTCRGCGPGKYSGVAGATTCDACPPGKFSGVTVDALGDGQWATTCTAPNAYSCYKAKDLKNPKFIASPFTIVDAYASGTPGTPGTAATIKGPAMVCAPVDVGTGVEDASKRQCCYKVAAKGLAKPHPQVATKDGRFTGSQLEVLKSQMICEPCGADPLP